MILDMLIGGGLVVAGAILGRLPQRRKKGKRLDGAVCACRHAKSYHEDGTGRCHQRVYVRSTWGEDGYHEDCRCKQYTGPEPLPEYFAPELPG